jgi:hypothetical protein
MGADNQGNDTGSIFQSPTHTPRPLAPPEYRQQALRSIITLNRAKGLSSLSFSELALQLRDQSLRHVIDPKVEPLSLESINGAVADLVQTRELIVEGRTVIFPALPATAR